jgi:LPXTG-motif cell wall-anchored protein
LKAMKRLSILVTVMLVFFISLPLSGAFAAENGKGDTTNSKGSSSEKAEKKDEKSSKGNSTTTETTEQETKAKNDNVPAKNESAAKDETKSKKEEAETAEKDRVISGETEQRNGDDSMGKDEPTDTKANEETGSEKVNSNKSTQIHLHLNKCTGPVLKVLVELKGEWKEMSNPGSSPLYKLLDSGEYVKDDVTAFKLIFTSGDELVVPGSDLKFGVEANGTINYWLEKCDLPKEDDPEKEQPIKNTQIHLHLKDCFSPVSRVLVEVNGEWIEMSNPGNSSLYKLPDGGDFVKDDITAFKLFFTNGKEMAVMVKDLKVGIEAEGTINYWLENCDLLDQEMKAFMSITLKIDESYGKINGAALLMMNGKRIEFKNANNVWTIHLNEEMLLENVLAIELMMDGKSKRIHVSKLPANLVEINSDVLSLQMNWNMDGEVIEDETNEDTEAAPVSQNPSSGSGGSSVSNDWAGDVLPQTGESSRIWFYLLGFMIAAGGIMLRIKKPLHNE